MSDRGLTVAQAAYNAGFRGQSLVQWTALGLAESKGNPTAHNYSDATKDDSYGIWQINYYGDLRDSRIAQYGPPESLLNADRNAQVAYAMSGGGQVTSPWQADFNNGSYYANLQEAQESVNQLLGGAVAPGAIGSPGSITTTTVAADTVTNKCLLSSPSVLGIGGGCFFRESNARAILGGLILAGGVVVASVGIVLLVGSSTNLTGVVGKVSPTGWVGALAASRGDREVDKGLKPTPEQQRQARQRMREQTVKEPFPE